MTNPEKESQYFFHTYKRLSIDVERGDGVFLVARDGTRYLDMFGGIAVNALGYNHPSVNRAITEQIGKYIHLSNLFVQDPQIGLAECLLKNSGFSKLFFTNSGTEAIEGAIKLARRWARGKNKTMIYGLSNSFHGRTFAAMSVTGRDKYRDGYEPLLPNTGILGFNDIADLEKNVNSSTLAVILEVIQGEGGINLVAPDYVEALTSLRKKFGFLIIADEIQSGIGRTGKLFGFNHWNLQPDIVVVAKALGGGLPLGAFLGADHLADVFSPGVHGTTFGGNPVACAAGLATLREITGNGVMDNAARMGTSIMDRMRQLQGRFPDAIADVRGKGLMIGLDLKFDGTEVNGKLLASHVLVNLTNTTVLRWLPPLILKQEHADMALGALNKILEER